MLNLLRMNLQHFADEGTAESTEASAEETTEETTENKNQPEKKYTDDDVDKIVGKKFKEFQKKIDKAQEEAARKAKLGEKDLLAEEIKERDARIAEYERKDKLRENGKIVSKTLSDAELPHDDDLNELLVVEDEDQTKLNVQAFMSYVSKIKKENARQDTPIEGQGFDKDTKNKKSKAEIAREKRIIK